MNIYAIEPGAKYAVESDSGKTYHITYAGSGDADPDYVALWECDCPAGQHGRDCKHLAAFFDWHRRVCDQCGEWRNDLCNCVGGQSDA